MTELEKMIRGELYDPGDAQLVQMRLSCRGLIESYNSSNSTQKNKRDKLLVELLGVVGKNINIEPPFFCDYGFNINLGDNVYMNFNCVMLDCASISIGNNTLIGPGVQFYAATHPVQAQERQSGLELAGPITVGENVWIGGGAIILPNVAIGDNTTIGAGAVVTKDVPSNVLAVGNPCRVIREL
ncbi:MAG: sugar O-acetyltransferase [Phycisphaerae bacterium]|nr:sugar O-acetyltransferase [Phycisphaerae bacterium]